MQYTAAILAFTPQEVLVVEIDADETYDTEVLKDKMRILKKDHPDRIVVFMSKDTMGRATYLGNRQVADILIDRDEDKFPWQTYNTD